MSISMWRMLLLMSYPEMDMGITFDTELYNNVEEIGIFTEQILKDSIWEYDATKKGTFTEYSEEKFREIPVSLFNKIVGYKLNYVSWNCENKNINKSF